MNHEMRTEYVNNAYGGIVGKTVKSVRPMSPEESVWDYDNYIGWLIEFTDGTVAIPASDPEGNGRGHLFIPQ
jgi:hypothetical protein